jgi:hypothetical protein
VGRAFDPELAVEGGQPVRLDRAVGALDRDARLVEVDDCAA